MKIVLITGVSGGIGKQICSLYKKNNWIVIGTDIKNSNNDCDFFITADLNNENDIKKMINDIKKKYNKLNCIINNAALQICKPIWEMSSNEWDLIYNINLKSIFLITKYSLDLLKVNFRGRNSLT